MSKPDPIQSTSGRSPKQQAGHMLMNWVSQEASQASAGVPGSQASPADWSLSQAHMQRYRQGKKKVLDKWDRNKRGCEKGRIVTVVQERVKGADGLNLIQITSLFSKYKVY